MTMNMKATMMISQMMLSSSMVLSVPFRVLISPYQECTRFDNYSTTMMMRPTLNPGEFHQKELMWFSRVMVENLNPEVLELLNWFGACCLRLKVNLGCYIFVGNTNPLYHSLCTILCSTNHYVPCFDFTFLIK